jgi:hypothetical protein
MRIDIETNSDVHECETCGNSWAEGGAVIIDGVEVIRRDASAHCFGGTNYSDDELLVMALKKMGHDVFVDGDRYHVCCVDEEYHGGTEQ